MSINYNPKILIIQLLNPNHCRIYAASHNDHPLGPGSFGDRWKE